MLHTCKQCVLSASLNETFPSFIFIKEQKMADYSSTDSDVDALLQKIANKVRHFLSACISVL